MLELYDQTVRECSGGAMARYLQQAAVPAAAFVIERVGDEARRIMAAAEQKRAGASAGPHQPTTRGGILRRIRRLLGEPDARRGSPGPLAAGIGLRGPSAWAVSPQRRGAPLDVRSLLVGRPARAGRVWRLAGGFCG